MPCGNVSTTGMLLTAPIRMLGTGLGNLPGTAHFLELRPRSVWLRSTRSCGRSEIAAPSVAERDCNCGLIAREWVLQNNGAAGLLDSAPFASDLPDIRHRRRGSFRGYDQGL